MVVLRPFALYDAATIQKKRYPAKARAEIEQLIRAWNKETYSGKRFAMLAIVHDDEPVGFCSWFEHTKSVVSFGVDVWEGERKKGYAFMALTQLEECVREKGFAIVQDQVRTMWRASGCMKNCSLKRTDMSTEIKKVERYCCF